LRTPERLAQVGLPVPRPGRADWPLFQGVGEELHADGRMGLVAPSAARPESLILCVFVARSTFPVDVVPSPPPTRVDAPPAPPTGMRT
jgi:hypothetical protein